MTTDLTLGSQRILLQKETERMAVAVAAFRDSPTKNNLKAMAEQRMVLTKLKSTIRQTP